MPTTSSRVRALLAAAGVALLPLVSLAVPGTAVAEPSPPAAVDSPTAEPSDSPSPSVSPCPITNPACHLSPVPSISATPSPTPSPTPSAVASRTPTATPTPRRTRSPRPDSTFTAEPGSTDDPVTASIGIGGVVPESATPTLTPKTSSSDRSTGDKITRLLALVLGGAALLGISGATGLYLTRHRHDH